VTSPSYRVLVVDDEEAVREMVITLLFKRGHACREAASAVEGLLIMQTNSFNAVISDILMPQLDGIGFTKEILKRYHRFPVMLMTGHAEIFSAQEALLAGAEEFIAKPFSIHEFYIRFLKMMRAHEVIGQLEAKRNELVFNIQNKSLKRIENLEKEIRKLKNRLSTLYVDQHAFYDS
jgi:DNA-binding NtrC family response regulator